MPSLGSLALLGAALSATLTAAVPAPQASQAPPSSNAFWLGDAALHKLDSVWDPDPDNATAPGYKVFRNVVTDYGADPSGGADASAAINKAMSDGDRCGGLPTSEGGCDSSTVRPAIIYFPPGTYKISKAILMYYYTQVIGDANNMPTLLATDDFKGMAVLDADPYADNGANWFTNQNNFFRQVRNFNIDIRQIKGGQLGAGIHWQVAQATSLQNINFIMSEAEGNQQQGIFMDNGSGGFMSDLTFNGGNYGAFLGSQQFTSRNLTFNNCKTAIFMNWNWGWTFHGITINGGTTGIDMGNGPDNQTVGSVILSDSKINNVENGVKFSFVNDGTNVPAAANTLFLDNVDMTNTPNAVVDRSNSTLLQGNKVIEAWASGHGYDVRGQRKDTYAPLETKIVQGDPKMTRPASLLQNGQIVSRSKPQYANYTVDQIVSAKGKGGCAGDGQTDDTKALQDLFDSTAAAKKIAFLEHGAYLVSDTIVIPKDCKIVGSIWSLLVADGKSNAFNDQKKPTPVFQIGKPGDEGSVEIQDVMFETKGAAPGAVMIEWNIKSEPGASGMWDSHVRIGGSAGTDLQGPEKYGGCRKSPETEFTDSAGCEGVFLMFHATKASSSVYVENCWWWVADHDLDHEQPQQISIYSARGALFENEGPAWLWGTASEHSVLYNYQINGAGALFGGFMQTETPYYQPNPVAPKPFDFNSEYDDPLFTICKNETTAGQPACKDAWGMRVYNSRDIMIYGAGMYSFFDNYEQTCVGKQNCQQNMIHIQNSQVQMFAASTKAAVNMIVDDDRGSVLDEDNRSTFCATVGYFLTDH